jgi:hypothetical protein
MDRGHLLNSIEPTLLSAASIIGNESNKRIPPKPNTNEDNTLFSNGKAILLASTQKM